jgi:hypothetical protein
VISDELIEEIIKEHIEDYDSIIEIDTDNKTKVENNQNAQNNQEEIKKYSLMDIRNFNLMNKEQIKELFIK